MALVLKVSGRYPKIAVEKLKRHLSAHNITTLPQGAELVSVLVQDTGSIELLHLGIWRERTTCCGATRFYITAGGDIEEVKAERMAYRISAVNLARALDRWPVPLDYREGWELA